MKASWHEHGEHRLVIVPSVAPGLTTIARAVLRGRIQRTIPGGSCAGGSAGSLRSASLI